MGKWKATVDSAETENERMKQQGKKLESKREGWNNQQAWNKREWKERNENGRKEGK